MQPPKQRQTGAGTPADRQAQMGQRAPGQRAPDEARPGSTSAQLKNDINSGMTGDKVNYFDPAAAPLGTDDEAAGTPPTPEEIHQARMAERSAPMDAPGADSRTPPHGTFRPDGAQNEEAWSESPNPTGTGRWIGYAVAIAIVVLLIYLMFSA